MTVVVIVLVVVAILAVVIGLRVRHHNDPVDSFRRQIDALGPEARRPTVNRVRRADDDSDQTGPDGS